MSKKVRADSILGTLTPDRQAEIAEHLRTHTLAESKAWLAADGIRISINSLSEWLSSYRAKQVFARAESSATEFRDWMASDFPDLSEAELDRRAAIWFQSEAMKGGDAETYLAFATARHKAEMDKLKLEQRERGMAQEREKWLAAQKTKIEAGLDALYQEIKSNAEARDLFQRFKAVITKATA